MTTPTTPEQDGARLWLRRWYMLRLTGSVVFIVLVMVGFVLALTRRDGPYRTRDEALRAPEIARQRAAAWNAEVD